MTNVGSAANATVNKPSGTAAGDLLVTCVSFEKGSDVVITPPTGWTLIRRTNNSTGVGIAAYYRVAEGSDPANYAFGLTSGAKWSIGISRITGANTSSPIGASAGQTGASGTSVTAPSITTTNANALILAFYGNKKAATYTPASGTTEHYDTPNTTSGLPSLMMAAYTQVAAGNTGAKTAVASEGESWMALQVAISASALPSSVKWAVGDGNWDTTTSNWKSIPSDNVVTYLDGIPATFDDSASGSSPITVTLTGNRTPSAVTNNSSKNYILTGNFNITGASLMKNGAGTLILANGGGNSFSSITISNGTLQIGNNNTNGSLGAASVSNHGGLSFHRTDNLTFANVISGSGSVVQNGSGTVTLTATNTYSGNTVVNNGALALGANASITNSPQIHLSESATLDVSAVSGGFTLRANQTLVISLDRDNVQTSGKVIGASTVNGALTVNNAGPAPQTGDAFTLFTSPPTGTFNTTNLPALGAGQNWWTTNNYASILVNELTAADMTYTKAKDVSQKIAISDVLTNVVSLPAGATLSVSAGSSTNGATIFNDGNYIYFVPGNNLSESFSYTVTDGRGGSATARITVNVVSAPGAAQNISVEGGQATVQFAGIPDYGYVVQRSTNLVDWVTLINTNAPNTGLFQFVDDFSDLGGTAPDAAYYRTAQP